MPLSSSYLRFPTLLLGGATIAAFLLATQIASAQQPSADDQPAEEAEAVEESAETPSPDPEPVEDAAPAEAEQTDAEESPQEEPETQEEESERIEQLDDENPGQGELDAALEAKIGAKNLADLSNVIDLLDSAMEKGLDPGNTDFAEEVLVATLVQRASARSSQLLGQRVANARNDPRWLRLLRFAMNDLQRAVALDETQTEAWMLIGRLQSLPDGDPSEARRALNKVIRFAEINATNPQVGPMDPQQLAQVYALRGSTQKSAEDKLADFDRAVEFHPDKVEYRLLRAQQHQAMENAEACLADIEHALTLAPDNPVVHEVRALALLMQERYDEALEGFDRATELAPGSLKPYLYRGQLYTEQDKVAEAIEQFDKAIEISPGNLVALLKRAELLMSMGDDARALADVETVLRTQGNVLQVHLMRVQLLQNLGRTDEAIAVLDRIAEAAAGRPEVQLQLAAFFANNEMPLQAIPTLDRVLELDPANTTALSLRGNMFLLVGKHAEALDDFAQTMKLDPEDSGVLNNYAWTLATSTFDELRDGPKAIEVATRACEIGDFEDPTVLSTLAAAYAETNDFESAIRWSQEAVEKATEQGTIEQFDGQLSAELESYKQGKPWRERQLMGSPDEDLPMEEEPEEEQAAFDEEAPLPPARSFDF